MSFMEYMESSLNKMDNYSMTENGALGYRTSGKGLLDINFRASSLREASTDEIVSLYEKCYKEDAKSAVKWAFFAGDVREGMGERRLFNTCMDYIVDKNPELAIRLLELIPYYTRYDNLIRLTKCSNTEVRRAVFEFIGDQLSIDASLARQGKEVSLLAKWLPSINSDSTASRKLALRIASKLKMTKGEYRKTLSYLRKYLDVTEVKMCGRRWSEIDYSKVPSRANLIYGDAFMRHDEYRRSKYLDEVSKGHKSIHSGVLYPHEIVSKYRCGIMREVRDTDENLEALWKCLPNTVESGSTLCVADGSGSMLSKINSQYECSALDVAQSLAIYCSERLSGEFKGKFMTFSSRPRLVDISDYESLRDKLSRVSEYTEVSNTNIEAVFELILRTAVEHSLKQEDMPKNILILSDMEFDMCTECDSNMRPNKSLFDMLKVRYEDAGYKLPRLVFWNIISRSNTIPMVENDLGVALVSGFSTNIMDMVTSGELDPYKCLTDKLNSDRYVYVDYCY